MCFIVVLAGLLSRWGLLLSARARGSGQMQPARTRGCALAPSLPLDWPGRRQGCPEITTHPRTLSAPGPRSGRRASLAFSLSPARRPPCLAPPQPAGARGKRGSSFPPGGGKQTKRRSRGGARSYAYSSGRPQRRRREPARVGVAACAARAALASGGSGLCAARVGPERARAGEEGGAARLRGRGLRAPLCCGGGGASRRAWGKGSGAEQPRTALQENNSDHEIGVTSLLPATLLGQLLKATYVSM